VTRQVRSQTGRCTPCVTRAPGARSCIGSFLCQGPGHHLPGRYTAVHEQQLLGSIARRSCDFAPSAHIKAHRTTARTAGSRATRIRSAFFDFASAFISSCCPMRHTIPPNGIPALSAWRTRPSVVTGRSGGVTRCGDHRQRRATDPWREAELRQAPVQRAAEPPRHSGEQPILDDRDGRLHDR